jgi:ABC-type multidrug transport system permease subunit
MGVKLYLRVPEAVFWTFAFPVLMLLGLGLVFGSDSDAVVKLVWARDTPVSPDLPGLAQALSDRGVRLERLPRAQAEAHWKLGKLPALLEDVPRTAPGSASTGARLRINRYLMAQGMQIEALVQQAYLLAQTRARGGPEPERVEVMMSNPAGHQAGPYAAYLLPGLLGLNLLTMGVFSTGIVDVTLRDKGGYKRLATTPLPRVVFLGAQLCVRLITVVASAAMLVLAGAVAFGIRNQGSYLALGALLMLGSACFISMGYVLASFARNVEAYNGIANLVFLPLMLLSGVYFSLDAAPQWLQRAIDVLPLAPLLRALRAVFNDGETLLGHGTDLAIVGVWTALLFGSAVRRFRWV